MRSIAFVGLGAMGAAMARQLVAHGHFQINGRNVKTSAPYTDCWTRTR